MLTDTLTIDTQLHEDKMNGLYDRSYWHCRVLRENLLEELPSTIFQRVKQLKGM